MLLDNFIAHMYGPLFLIIYFVWVLIVISITRYKVRNLEKITNSALLSGGISEKEIATLFRGKDGLRDFLLFNLLAQNILVVGKKLLNRCLVQNPEQCHLNIAQLSPVEQALYHHYDVPKSIDSSSAILDNSYQALENSLINRGFVKSDLYQKKLKSLAIQSHCLLLSLGGYKLVVALVKGHTNILLLVIIMLVVFIIQIQYFKRHSGKKKDSDPAYRLTEHGKRHLSSIALNIRRLMPQQIAGKKSPSHSSMQVAQHDYGQLFLWVLFTGAHNLPHTLAYLKPLFPDYLNNAALNKSLEIIGIHEPKTDGGVSSSGGCSTTSSSGCSNSSGCSSSSGCGGCGGD